MAYKRLLLGTVVMCGLCLGTTVAAYAQFGVNVSIPLALGVSMDVTENFMAEASVGLGAFGSVTVGVGGYLYVFPLDLAGLTFRPYLVAAAIFASSFLGMQVVPAIGAGVELMIPNTPLSAYATFAVVPSGAISIAFVLGGRFRFGGGEGGEV